MLTRFKLNEAHYFFNKLVETKGRERTNLVLSLFYLSAFLSAWRSVIDVMLYDFAEYFDLGLTREDKMMARDFEIASKVLKRQKAFEFLRWWNKKRNDLCKKPLGLMRIIIVHRGYRAHMQKYKIFTSGSFGSVFATPQHEMVFPIPSEISEVKFSDLIKMCREGYEEMELIVDEAEKEFNVKL